MFHCITFSAFTGRTKGVKSKSKDRSKKPDNPDDQRTLRFHKMTPLRKLDRDLPEQYNKTGNRKWDKVLPCRGSLLPNHKYIVLIGAKQRTGEISAFVVSYSKTLAKEIVKKIKRNHGFKKTRQNND